MTRVFVALVLLLAGPAAAAAQPVFAGHEIFPPSEFAARRARVIGRIGPGVAIMEAMRDAQPGMVFSIEPALLLDDERQATIQQSAAARARSGPRGGGSRRRDGGRDGFV